MSVHRQQQHSSRSAPYPTSHHHPHSHHEVSTFDDGPTSAPSTSTHTRRRNSRQPPQPDEASFLPSNDRNEWYYPTARPLAPGEDSEDDMDDSGLGGSERSEEALQMSRSGQGNWGHKLVKGSRWMRRGKIIAWGPHKADWDVCNFCRYLSSSIPFSSVCGMLRRTQLIFCFFFRWTIKRESVFDESCLAPAHPLQNLQTFPTFDEAQHHL